MTSVAFPSEEALVAAITAELVSAAELAGPVRFWREKGVVFVRPIDTLREETLSRLVERGARSSQKRVPKRAKSGASWLEAVATSFVGEPAEAALTVLFELRDVSSMLDVAAEMIRLGCDRQRFRPGAVPLLMVDAPPYYTVLSALDARSSRRAYVPGAAPRVWVELGCMHPLADRISAPEDELLLIARDGWQLVPAGVWEDIDQLIDVVLPGARVALVAEPLERRLEIRLRLTRTGTIRQTALWVLRSDAQAQIERNLVDLPTEVVDALLFAVGTIDDAEVVVLRAREGAPPIELALHAERYAPHPELPSLWLPEGAALEPPLGRGHLMRLLPEGRATSWTRPQGGGDFIVEHASADAFRPLSDWVDYVMTQSAEGIGAWIEATTFELDAIERSDVRLGDRRAEPAAADGDEVVDTAAAPDAPAPRAKKKRKAKKKKRNAKKKAPVLLEGHTDSSEAAQHAAELEEQFLQLTSPADAEDRLSAWRELGHAYAALGQRGDADHAFCRVLWERSGTEATEIAAAWTAGLEHSLTELVEKEWPTPEELRWFVARLHAGDVSLSDHELVARFIDAHQEGLDVRLRWLAHLAVSRIAGGDALRLTRARDRALSDLRGGLSLDRDVPSFLRARATGLGDAAVGRALVAELEALWETFANAKRKRSAIEASEELTAAYVRRLFAYGFARLGQSDLVASLVAPRADDPDRGDPVHGALLAMLEERVRQGAEGLSPTTPLPGEVMARLNALAALDRYKVDRLREVSEVLEPVERLDAISGFKRGEVDPRGDALAALRALDAGAELSARVQDVVRDACAPTTKAEERARMLDGAMDFFYALPVSQATALLEELALALDPIEPFERALVIEEALVLAAHFGHEPLIDELSVRLSRLIGEVDGSRAADLGRVVRGALRTLRRVGLRDRAAALLEAVAELTQGDDAPSELLVARVHVAGGFLFLGDHERAEPLLESARERAADEGKPILERLPVIRAVAHAAALSPAPERVAEVRALAALLPKITDVLSTNTHFCLSLLHFAESLITGLVPPDRGRDGPAAAYLDEDEHLVRRRIHRDLKEALASA